MAKDNIDVTGKDVLDEMFPEEVGTEVENTPESAVAVLEAPIDAESASIEPAPEEASTETPAPEAKTEEKPEIKAAQPEGETHVPVAVVKDLRADKRNLQQQLDAERIARAKAEARAELLAELAAKGVNPQAKSSVEDDQSQITESPLERFGREFPDEAVPARIMLDQRKWEQEQTALQASQAKTQTLAEQVQTSIAKAKETLSDEKVGEGLGLDSVVGLARQAGLITSMDEQYAASQGIHAAQAMYNQAVFKIKTAGGTAAQELNRRILAARATRQASATPNGPKTPTKTNNNNQSPAKPGKSPIKSDDDEAASNITNFLFS